MRIDCLSTCVWTARVRAYGLPEYVRMDCLGTCVWTAWVREYGLPGYVRMDCLAVWARAPDHRCVRPAELKPARPQLAVPFLTMECPNNRAVRTIALQACQNVYTVQQPCRSVCSNRDAMPKQSHHATQPRAARWISTASQATEIISTASRVPQRATITPCTQPRGAC